MPGTKSLERIRHRSFVSPLFAFVLPAQESRPSRTQSGSTSTSSRDLGESERVIGSEQPELRFNAEGCSFSVVFFLESLYVSQFTLHRIRGGILCSA